MVTGARLMVRNTSSLIAFVEQGFGTTILPSLAVKTLPEALRFLPLEDPAAVRRILLLTLRRRASRPDRECLHRGDPRDRQGASLAGNAHSTVKVGLNQAGARDSPGPMASTLSWSIRRIAGPACW